MYYHIHSFLFCSSMANNAASCRFGQPSGTCVWPKDEVRGAQARHSLAALMVQAHDEAQPHAALWCACTCSLASGHAAALMRLALHACAVSCVLGFFQNMPVVTGWIWHAAPAPCAGGNMQLIQEGRSEVLTLIQTLIPALWHPHLQAQQPHLAHSRSCSRAGRRRPRAGR